MSDETKRDDGGPAFPGESSWDADGDPKYGAKGMSLRDWFAATIDHDDVMVLVGACNERSPETVEGVAMALATLRYAFADAMLKARNQ